MQFTIRDPILVNYTFVQKSTAQQREEKGLRTIVETNLVYLGTERASSIDGTPVAVASRDAAQGAITTTVH